VIYKLIINYTFQLLKSDAPDFFFYKIFSIYAVLFESSTDFFFHFSCVQAIDLVYTKVELMQIESFLSVYY